MAKKFQNGKSMPKQKGLGATYKAQVQMDADKDGMKGGGKTCYAEGGMVRGTGCAVKGKEFKGVF